MNPDRLQNHPALSSWRCRGANGPNRSMQSGQQPAHTTRRRDDAFANRNSRCRTRFSVFVFGSPKNRPHGQRGVFHESIHRVSRQATGQRRQSWNRGPAVFDAGTRTDSGSRDDPQPSRTSHGSRSRGNLLSPGAPSFLRLRIPGRVVARSATKRTGDEIPVLSGAFRIQEKWGALAEWHHAVPSLVGASPGRIQPIVCQRQTAHTRALSQRRHREPTLEWKRLSPF